MLKLAQFYLNKSQPKKSDYAKKYEEMIRKMESLTLNDDVVNSVNDKECLIKKLKAFRLEQSRKENVKLYLIFTDVQMNDLIEKNPQNKAELIKVSGFGAVRVEKYGDAILNLLHQK